ncbi:hypothetical protein QJS10_CPB19g01291 [Acorus calamus]|uniref:J domain-containing protein n=1 Tax=Acorus calamus TaxID=4465 RepID=A0AAV9CD49_ACOCL|nr:hypothetical protein QJS10_CPB19g01291 [Acorus calamus]
MCDSPNPSVGALPSVIGPLRVSDDDDRLGGGFWNTFCSPSAATVAASAGGKCWSCGTSPSAPSLPFLFCGSCRAVQPVKPSDDYFKIFGLERGYDIGDSDLESKYKEWQKKLHPDLVHMKSEREKAYAAEQSARVIDAYRTLGKPCRRAIYLLKLEGIEVDEEQTVSEPDLLAEMMELREAVDEASNSEALKQIRNQIEHKLEAWSNSFSKSFKDRDFEGSIVSIQRMTYYERAIEEAIKKL